MTAMQHYHPNTLNHPSTKRQKPCEKTEDCTCDDCCAPLDTLATLLHNGHETNLDLSHVLQEEDLLLRLLDLAHERRHFLEVGQSPFLALDASLIQNVLEFLDPLDLCRTEGSCQTLRSIVQDVWQEAAIRQGKRSNSSIKTPKMQVQTYFSASTRAKELERLAPAHRGGAGASSSSHRHGGVMKCRGCSAYPNRLDTAPLHAVQDYDFFVRMAQNSNLLWEGFAPMKCPISDHAGLPSHPMVDLKDVALLIDWPAMDKLLEELNTYRDHRDEDHFVHGDTSIDDDLMRIHKAMSNLVSNLTVTVLAIPKKTPLAPPRLVISTRGTFSNLPSSILFSGDMMERMEEEDGDWNIPLEACRHAAHFKDTADNARASFSVLQMDIQVGLPQKGTGGQRAVLKGLEFPEVLGSTSSSAWDTAFYI